ncbi:hypothetical protein BHE74_00050130 [Ensete ventricosum]|nr:hypothetical protein BHE74_00050130 [Ensete ventricosum]
MERVIKAARSSGSLNLSNRSLKLDCSSNQLKELPSSLGRCLDLSELKLTSFTEKMLMSWTLLTEINAGSIGLLVKLIRLDFHQNSE